MNIFATLRFIPQIINQFNSNMLLEIRAYNKDMRKYLDDRISQSKSKFLKTYYKKIKTKITKAVGEMYVLFYVVLANHQTNIFLGFF